MDVQKNRAVKGRTFIILMAEKWLVVIFSKSGVHWQSYRARVTKQSLNHWLQKNATSVFYSRIKNSVLISGRWMLLNEGMSAELVYVCAWNDRNIVNLLNLLNMRTWLKCLLFSMDVFSRSTIFFVCSFWLLFLKEYEKHYYLSHLSKVREGLSLRLEER